ncbi:DUF4861 domain-containing protein [Pseudozobellia thermophila]|uniref:DUF4861 domain-containing protein n=1 Tax=Pseudozobellia thermophila TaxID=192903 RepID=A0A1M6G2F2_9FLAO|nr:DUF4861 domain-containing protein [Pseudozobellia thermophila]SHJ04052.1 protein of unknown function [Pseudozobellia thermophila]
MKTDHRSPVHLAFLGLLCLATACAPAEKDQTLLIEVKNDLGFARNEVVGLDVQDLKTVLNGTSEGHIRIKRNDDQGYLRTQWIDYDQDGTNDELLFQAEVAANGSSEYTILIDSTKAAPESDVVAYSRLVPERTDDYTWENDKVAFRTYGPTGEREALAGVPGSTLSSGIDLWLKRTDKSIINKWYKAHETQPGYYHTDHGEGYDPYHVGASRGTGGIGIWENDSLLVSNNFTASRTLAAGPLRTVFELDYAPWSEYGVRETKRITLDLGSNFSKFDISLSSDRQVPNYTVGITLHNNEGEVAINKEEGWFRHWETIDGAKVGEGVVIDPKTVTDAIAYKSEVPDQSNLLIVTEPQGTLSYYAGFAWEKSGQVASVEDWETLLSQQAQIMSSPLSVTIKASK